MFRDAAQENFVQDVSCYAQELDTSGIIILWCYTSFPFVEINRVGIFNIVELEWGFSAFYKDGD